MGPGNQYGIYNPLGFDKNVVKNGTVDGFNYGVTIEYSSNSKLLNLTSVNNTYAALSYWYGQNGELSNLEVIDSADYGIYLYENEKVNLSDSKVTGNGGGNGVYDYLSYGSIKNVKSSNSDYGVYLYNPLAGYKS